LNEHLIFHKQSIFKTFRRDSIVIAIRIWGEYQPAKQMFL